MNLHLLSRSSFQPEELAELQAVYDDITSQRWFLADRKEDFAKYLFETLPATAGDFQKWRSTVEASARMFYSRWDMKNPGS